MANLLPVFCELFLNAGGKSMLATDDITIDQFESLETSALYNMHN